MNLYGEFSMMADVHVAHGTLFKQVFIYTTYLKSHVGIIATNV